MKKPEIVVIYHIRKKLLTHCTLKSWQGGEEQYKATGWYKANKDQEREYFKQKPQFAPTPKSNSAKNSEAKKVETPAAEKEA